jgi:transcriptional regulator with XRE-family HTH domain
MPPATPDQSIDARIVEVLVEARHAACLRQVDLAKRLGRAQSFVSKYETHTRPIGLVEYLKIAQALEQDPVTLLNKILELPND